MAAAWSSPRGSEAPARLQPDHDDAAREGLCHVDAEGDAADAAHDLLCRGCNGQPGSSGRSSDRERTMRSRRRASSSGGHQCGEQELGLVGMDRAQVHQHTPSATRATTAASGPQRAARRSARASRARARRAWSARCVGAAPPPTTTRPARARRERGSTRPRAGGERSGAPQLLSRRCSIRRPGAARPRPAAGARPARRRARPASSCPRAGRGRAGSSAWLDASRRPAAMPACGPPSSLSPLKVTTSTPSASARRPSARASAAGAGR